MYEKFYRLRERPFALTPDPDYLYLSRVHRETLAHLRLGIESNAGFIVITGEVGAGKTTLLQTLLRTLDERATVARLVNTLLEPKELVEAILIDFGIDPAPTKPAMVRDLARFLVEQKMRGQQVLVVIDEAQNLPHGALEELRMISNLETEKSKLVQIVLVGQPEMRERLLAPDLEQLRQRIAVRHHLNPLDAKDTHLYINHRLKRAAIDKPLCFGREVTDAIHDRSGGIPRMVNVICDAALMAGYGEEKHRISSALIVSVFQELESVGVLGSRTPGRRPWARAAVEPPWPTDEPALPSDEEDSLPITPISAARSAKG